MKNIFSILALFIQSIVLCQDNSIEFYPLTIVGKVSKTDLMTMKKIDSLNKKDYFFTENYKEDYGLFLVKKENENWVVYDFELYLNSGHNSIIKSIKKENNRFVSIQVMSMPSGICESHYGKIILIDLIRNEFIDFFNSAESRCYGENGNVTSVSKCYAKFSLKDNFLKIKNSKKGTDCMESGIYQYRKGKFVKIK